MIWIQIEHLRARAQAEPQAGDDRRALQPATAGRAGDHVAVAVGDSNMHGVPSHFANRLSARTRPVPFGHRLARPPRQARLAAGRRAGPELERRAITYEGAPGGAVVRREEGGQWHLPDVGIRIPRLTVGAAGLPSPAAARHVV